VGFLTQPSAAETPDASTPAGVVSVAPAGPSAHRLELWAGSGYLAAPGYSGAALDLGLRCPVAPHLALSFDLGYGVVGRSSEVQDRWWLMPAIAWVIPMGPVRTDLGAGVGLGATSGYASMSAYEAGPFSPTWAYQMVPAARAHALATLAITPDVALFGRLDVASLLLQGTSIGSRVGGVDPPVDDRVWGGVTLGAALGVL
jgi:hypothetical protein